MLDMTTSNVVTMEYVPGIKINDIDKIEQAGIDRQLLAKRSAEAYLTQLCRHGFFRTLQTHMTKHVIYLYYIDFQMILYLLFVFNFIHNTLLLSDCDPHPGNLACDSQFGGRLIFYDFG